jgi:hypothetical protein
MGVVEPDTMLSTQMALPVNSSVVLPAPAPLAVGAVSDFLIRKVSSHA